MRKKIIFFCFSSFVFAQQITIVKNIAWPNIEKAAIVKLIKRQKLLEHRIDLLEKKINDKQIYIVKTYAANIRKYPTIKSPKVGYLKQGKEVKIKYFKGYWGKISKNRWISKYVICKKE